MSANPGLKVNLLFCFYTFLGTVYFQTSQNKTFINSYQVSENKTPIFLRDPHNSVPWFSTNPGLNLD